MIKVFILLTTLSLLTGCQTPRAHELAKIQNGMAKDRVIEVVGGPNRSYRRNGVDRWVYFLWDQMLNRQTIEVHFSEGICVYSGPPRSTSISPNEQDLINIGALDERAPVGNSTFEALPETKP